MNIVETTALKKIKSLTKRHRIIQGGTSAGKTIAVLVYLIAKAQHEKLSISIVSESFPHLKRGAMRDFFSILDSHGYYNESQHNKTDSIYNFPNGSFIEFFGADQPDKVRGPRRDILFINEANNVKYETYTQLEIRTKIMAILDFNPTSEFWAHEKVMPHVDYDFLKLTYKDNEVLDPEIVKAIESKKHNKNWWKVFGLGEVGIKEGQIYDNWTVIDNIPETARLEALGMDFGYTNDPTSIIAVYKHDNALILDERAYQRGMSNQQIAEKLKSMDRCLVVADSAEPKSIDEIATYGIEIKGSQKGKDSVAHGIQLVQDQKLLVTKRSTNLIKELRNYMWKTDRDGKPLNTPEHDYSHAMDAVRYALVELLNPKQETVIYF